MMRRIAPSNYRRGFTLIEMIVVVAIITVLGSIAIPRYIEVQNRARRAELPTIIDSLYTAQKSYHAANDAYLVIPTNTPRDTPNRQLAVWPDNTEFNKLDWHSDGQVRGVYRLEGDGENTFRIIGESDVDNDGTRAQYIADELTPILRTTSPIVF